MITPVSGSRTVNPISANAGRRTISISSVPYADDEMQSDESTPRARNLLNRS
jgi:hypothetical protein